MFNTTGAQPSDNKPSQSSSMLFQQISVRPGLIVATASLQSTVRDVNSEANLPLSGRVQLCTVAAFDG